MQIVTHRERQAKFIGVAEGSLPWFSNDIEKSRKQKPLVPSLTYAYLSSYL